MLLLPVISVPARLRPAASASFGKKKKKCCKKFKKGKRCKDCPNR
jgi:hypothetical protein